MKMKWGNHQIKYCNNIAYTKWMYNKILMLFGDNIDNIGSKSDVTKRQRGLATKISVSCLQAINIYNLYMDGVDLMDQLKSVYQLLTTSFLPFAWCCTHKSFHYLQKARKYRTYSNGFKLFISERIIVSFVTRKIIFWPCKSSRKYLPGPDSSWYKPIFLESCRQCTVCSKKRLESKLFAPCSTCDVSLCLLKNRKCFSEYYQ